MSEYRATFNYRGKEDTNLLTTKLGTQQLISKIYKQLFGVNPYKGLDTTSQGEKVRGFEDAKLEDFKVLYQVYEKVKEYNIKKTDEQYDKMVYLDDSDS